MATGICLYCGNTFLPQRKSAKYCSGRCRTAYHRLTRKADQCAAYAIWNLRKMQAILTAYGELEPTIDKLIDEVVREGKRLKDRTWKCPKCGQLSHTPWMPDICLTCGSRNERWVLIGAAAR